jgi:hypothetical protein
VLKKLNENEEIFPHIVMEQILDVFSFDEFNIFDIYDTASIVSTFKNNSISADLVNILYTQFLQFRLLILAISRDTNKNMNHQKFYQFVEAFLTGSISKRNNSEQLVKP